MTEHTSRNSITVTQSGITFNVVKPSVDLAGVPANGIYSNSSSQSTSGSGLNAIDIDWGQAKLPNSNITLGVEKKINTTGELLELINEMQKEIYVLSAAVIALSSQV